MENLDEYLLMERACEISKESVNKGCGPFGCVITDMNNNTIFEGNNRVTEENDPTAHAEIVAIRGACKKMNSFDLSNCKLFSSCEPCPMCLSAIYWARIKHVYYSNTRNDAKKIGFDDAYIYDELNKDNSAKSVTLKRIESNNAIDSFNIWHNKREKILY